MSTRRRSLTEAQRIDVLHAHHGRCYLCGGIINLARARLGEVEPFEVEHAHALGLGGTDTPDNWFPAHVSCHKEKTRRDRRAMAKVARAERARAVKAGEAKAKPKRKIAGSRLPGGRGDRIRKRIDGGVIDTSTGRVIWEGRTRDR